ncbi:MAG: hypothetical protein JW955_25970, partial [Sedimentisphaerales bacterium]|nr:hypothetical protein [Sedimentisphaerales bacterium]
MALFRVRRGNPLWLPRIGTGPRAGTGARPYNGLAAVDWLCFARRVTGHVAQPPSAGITPEGGGATGQS